VLALVGTHELWSLFHHNPRPPYWLCLVSVLAVVGCNWLVPLSGWPSAWRTIGVTFALAVIAAFLVEMARFETPGESMRRVTISVFVVAYLGLLPCFLAQLRWLPGEPWVGTLALALTIFVPKCGDIGAYFTGRLLGRHKMSPVLSPKKTWEGAAGGMAAAIGVAIFLNRQGPLLPNVWAEIGFGLSVGLAGLFGDLAESLIKRDCQEKDASHAVPGFGGVLDVVDAILFAAPVSFLWFLM
ncbi:MAG: phosphatidate cytidylyltransferase, partial [Gemmataceae bacterium]